MGTRTPGAVLLAAAVITSAAGCGSSSMAAGRSPSPAVSSTRHAGESAAQQDAGTCTAFSGSFKGVPPDIESSYESQYDQPLATYDFVLDASSGADAHLQALINTWYAADTGPGSGQVLDNAVNAVEAWCAKEGDPVTG